MKKPINVLSLFDGISCGRVALKRAGIPVGMYLSSEIDKHAIEVTNRRWPDTIQLGDVKNVNMKSIASELYTDHCPRIDLLMGGSPCTDLSFAGGQKGLQAKTLAQYLKMKRSGHKFEGQSFLFWEFVRLLKELKPKYFLLENVPMKKENLKLISDVLGVQPVFIDSKNLSAQNRKRYYWANFPIKEINHDVKGIMLKDILEDGKKVKAFNYSSSGRGGGKVEGRFTEAEKAMTLTAGGYSTRSLTGVIQVNPSKESGNRQPYIQNRMYSKHGKAPCLTSGFTRKLKVAIKIGAPRKTIYYRNLTPVECERLQNLPDGYTEGISQTQRYRSLGNGWNVNTIIRILRGIK